MQQHRETAETDLREVVGYLVLLRRQKFYGDITIKYREGVIVGHVHEDRDHLVTGLPQATAEEIEAVLHTAVAAPITATPPRRINPVYDKDALDELSKIGQKIGDTAAAALKRGPHGRT